MQCVALHSTLQSTPNLPLGVLGQPSAAFYFCLEQHLVSCLAVQEDFERGSETTVVPERDAAQLVVAPLLDALAHLHSHGIIHRVGGCHSGQQRAAAGSNVHAAVI